MLVGCPRRCYSLCSPSGLVVLIISRVFCMQSGQKSEIFSCSDFTTTVQVIWASCVFGKSAEQAEQVVGSLLNIPICFSASFWVVSSDKFLRLGVAFFFLLRLTCLACFFVPDIYSSSIFPPKKAEAVNKAKALVIIKIAKPYTKYCAKFSILYSRWAKAACLAF